MSSDGNAPMTAHGEALALAKRIVDYKPEAAAPLLIRSAHTAAVLMEVPFCAIVEVATALLAAEQARGKAEKRGKDALDACMQVGAVLNRMAMLYPDRSLAGNVEAALAAEQARVRELHAYNKVPLAALRAIFNTLRDDSLSLPARMLKVSTLADEALFPKSEAQAAEGNA